jgi:hypothetical protein
VRALKKRREEIKWGRQQLMRLISFFYKMIILLFVTCMNKIVAQLQLTFRFGWTNYCLILSIYLLASHEKGNEEENVAQNQKKDIPGAVFFFCCSFWNVIENHNFLKDCLMLMVIFFSFLLFLWSFVTWLNMHCDGTRLNRHECKSKGYLGKIRLN